MDGPLVQITGFIYRKNSDVLSYVLDWTQVLSYPEACQKYDQQCKDAVGGVRMADPFLQVLCHSLVKLDAHLMSAKVAGVHLACVCCCRLQGH